MAEPKEKEEAYILVEIVEVEPEEEEEESKPKRQKEKEEQEETTVVVAAAATATTAKQEPKSLAEMGYKFNETSKLVTINDEPFKFVNQQHYEQLGAFIAEEVQRRLRDELNLVEHFLPLDVPKNGKSVNVFTTKDILTSTSPLLVLICGSGAVLAGQIARSLCINETLNEGTLIPDIKNALSKGWQVLVMNPNRGNFLNNGISPEEHAIICWNTFAKHSHANSIGIFAHSHGGFLTCHILDRLNSKELSKIKVIALTDSMHCTPKKGSNGSKVFRKEMCCNWISSDKPINTECGVIFGVHCLSSGHPKHEYTTESARPSYWKHLEKYLPF